MPSPNISNTEAQQRTGQKRLNYLEGWVLDISVHEKGFVLWMKLENEATVRCFYKYSLSFYVSLQNLKHPIARLRTNGNGSRLGRTSQTDQPQNEHMLESLRESLLENENIEDIEIVNRFVDTSDSEKKPVFRIIVKSPTKYSAAVESVRKLGLFKFYNSDLPLVQLFMYETDLFPFCFCRIAVNELDNTPKQQGGSEKSELDKSSKKYDFIAKKIEILDDTESIGYRYPPLRVVWLRVFPRSTSVRPTKSDPIARIELERDPFSAPFSFEGVATPDCIVRGNRQPEKNKELKEIEEIEEIENDLLDDEEENPEAGLETYTIEADYKLPRVEKDLKSNSNESEQSRVSEMVVLRSPEEHWLLEEMMRVIHGINPDIIFTSNGDEDLFPYLLSRAEACRVSHLLVFSRDGKRLSSGMLKLSGNDFYMSYGATLHRSRTQFYLNGRLHIDSAVMGGLHFDDGNIYGIIEISRISRVLPQRLTRITIGGALSSLQFYYAIKNDILIPEEKTNSEDFRSGYNLLVADRGGYIYQPTVGFFTDVAELDFSAMYPSIMVKYNVSPETLNCKCCVQDGNKVPGLAYHTCIRRTGIVPLSIKLPLTKRLKYKALLKNATGSDYVKYKNIDSALKWILVVCFGYLGFKNARFGRIEAHQTVCAYSREYLLRLSEIASSKGFRILHGIVDSLWLQAVEPKEEGKANREIKEICMQTEEESMLPIGFSPEKDWYKFISFLPTKEFEGIGALNRYWGVKKDNEIKVRGIDIRRRDVPRIVKEYQREVMQIFSECSNEEEFMKTLRGKVKRKTLQYFALMDSGNVSPDRLAVTIRVTRPADGYKVNNYQAVASKQLEINGISVRPGQSVKYIITDANNPDATQRVIVEELYSKRSIKYDVEKYKELIFRALKNLIHTTIPDDFTRQDSSIKGLDRFLDADVNR